MNRTCQEFVVSFENSPGREKKTIRLWSSSDSYITDECLRWSSSPCHLTRAAIFLAISSLHTFVWSFKHETNEDDTSVSSLPTCFNKRDIQVLIIDRYCWLHVFVRLSTLGASLKRELISNAGKVWILHLQLWHCSSETIEWRLIFQVILRLPTWTWSTTREGQHLFDGQIDARQVSMPMNHRNTLVNKFFFEHMPWTDADDDRIWIIAYSSILHLTSFSQ